MKRCLFFVFMISALLCGCSRRNSLLKSATDQNLKVGFIYNGKINDKGYTQAQDASRIELERKGVRTMYVEENRAGCTFITVDALKEAVPFYLKNGFKFLKKSEENDGKETSLLYFNLTSLS